MATQTIVAIQQEAAPKSLLDQEPIQAVLSMENYNITVKVVLLKDNFQPGRVELSIDRTDPLLGVMQAVGVLMTTALRGGVPLDRVLSDLEECEPGFPSGKTKCAMVPNAQSLVNLVARWLRNSFVNTEPCKLCGVPTQHYDVYKFCHNCNNTDGRD